MNRSGKRRPDLPRGLYAIADASLGDPIRVGAALAVAGCQVIQFRAKGWTDHEVADAAGRLLELLRPHGCLLLLNDRASVAAAVGADGVHLGQDDGSLAEARDIMGPQALIGRSTHDLEQVRRAEADYIGFGPVFESMVKARSPRGLTALAEACRQAHQPVVAIGGINVHSLSEVRAAGAHGWAVISALSPAAPKWQPARTRSVVNALQGDDSS